MMIAKAMKVLTKHQIKEIQSQTDSRIEHWCKISEFPKHYSKWFIAARDESFESDFHTAKIGCVIVYKKHIIGKGHNQLKTDPYQKRYNEKYREWTTEPEFSKTCGHTIHAEIDALKSIPYPIAIQVNWNKVEVFIYRVSIGLVGYSGLSLPCPACAHALNDLGISKAYYTTGRIEKPFGCCDL